jgi:hypothetical protein
VQLQSFSHPFHKTSWEFSGGTCPLQDNGMKMCLTVNHRSHFDGRFSMAGYTLKVKGIDAEGRKLG